MSLLASVAKKFVSSEWHNIIDQADQAMSKYPNTKEGALQALQSINGTTQDIQKMIDIANKNTKFDSFFNMLGVNKSKIIHMGNQLLSDNSASANTSTSTNASNNQENINNSSINELKQRIKNL